MLLIDDYANSNRLRDFNINIKSSITLFGIILSMVSSNIYILLLLPVCFSLFIINIAKVNHKDYLELLKIPLVFLVMGTIAIVININFNPNNLIFNINIFNLYIGVSQESIRDGLFMVLRAVSCLISVYFFILTTPFNKILVLLKRIHISDTIIELTMLMYRFIFIFLEEVSEIKKSQELRFGYINIRNSYNSIGLLVRVLFNKLLIRYEDMYISLDMKLYDGKFPIVEDENV